MYSLLSHLRSAFHFPKDHLRTLWREIVPTGDERIIIDPIHLCAEAEVSTVGHGRALIFVPVEGGVINRNPLLSIPSSTILSSYRVLNRELVIGDKEYDVIYQPIPLGDPLNLSPTDVSTAIRMIDTLERECRNIGFSHNNLSAENIIVGNDNHLYPIRYHDATTSGCKDDFNLLRDLFADWQTEMLILNDATSNYTCKYCDIYDLKGGFMRFCDDGLFGYKDHNGEDAIPAQFIWAGDFCENRAVVETEMGFGVINSRGEYVIPPFLESLYYDAYGSLFYYYEREQLCAYDYNGEPLAADDSRLDHLR